MSRGFCSFFGYLFLRGTIFFFSGRFYLYESRRFFLVCFGLLCFFFKRERLSGVGGRRG